LSGCANDLNSWWDPSTVGRWEYTPTVVPILDRIDIIEEDEANTVETSDVMPEDLIPEAKEYEVGPGDQLLIDIFDFLAQGVPSEFQRNVDGSGMIDLPQINQVKVLGLTSKQIEQVLVRDLREKGIIQDALVTVQTVSQRDATYAILGAVGRVGRYVIPAPDYRLLDAITEAGGVPPMAPTIFVIRQAALTDEVKQGQGVDAATPIAPEQATPDDATKGQNLEDLIDRLTEPTPPPPSPVAFGSSAQPESSQKNQPAAKPSTPPMIDLQDSQQMGASTQGDSSDGVQTGGQWVFLDGTWVHVDAGDDSEPGDLADGPNPLATGAQTAADLMTQRVIKVPLKPLLQGNAAFNIVIRPGDVINVPSPEQGLVYVAGRGIARPGTYNLPSVGRLTLTKAVMAAGGLSPIGIPSRTDLTRMVGPNRQATIRLNLGAIFEGSEPDIFLKSDDMINVGTTWWAQPLAIIRNGFRTTYGFGFLLDRNFGNDVFGAPPFSRQ